MPSCMILGFFGLADGQRVASQGPAATMRYHNTYTTTIQTEEAGPDGSIEARFRVWSSNNTDLPLPNNTVVFAYARLFIPPRNGGFALVDAYYAYPFGGNPSDDGYEDNIPDLTHALVSVVGSVQSVSQATEDDNNRRLTLATGDRVWDQPRSCTVEAVFHRRNRRWDNVSMPGLQSTIQVFGRSIGFRRDGALIVEVESLTYNATTAAPGPAPGTPPSTPPGPSTPSNKRRKFNSRKEAAVTPDGSVTSSPMTSSPLASKSSRRTPLASSASRASDALSLNNGAVVGPSTSSTMQAATSSAPPLITPELDLSDLSDAPSEPIPNPKPNTRGTRTRQTKKDGKKKASE